MRVLVCGGRNYGNRDLVYSILDDIFRTARSGKREMVVIHGGSSGADKLAGCWARSRQVPVLHFPAKWREGRRAGPIRNGVMLAKGKPNFVIAFPGGLGTDDMCSKAHQAGLEVRRIADRVQLSADGTVRVY